MLKKKQREGREQVFTSKLLKSGSVTQADFERCLAIRLGVTIEDAHTITRAFLDELQAWLLDGFRVKFRGFGTIGTKMLKERTFYNCLLNEEITTPPKRIVHFEQSRKFCKVLKARYKNIWQQYADKEGEGDVLE